MAIARWYQASITVLHVCSPVPVAAFSPGPVIFEPTIFTPVEREQRLAETRAFAGRERIFDRSRAILGRKVQYCHPPKSVHIVNQIVRDFKAGKQDRARFWINMRGRMIYICYYAMRDAENNYLGTLEVTQDLTEVRSLEGEQRLLAYDEAK